VEICFHPLAWQDCQHWHKTDRKKLKRINELIRDIVREPHQGPGKPEPLRGNWSGYWSRRIDREHRLVYTVERDRLLIAQCRYHY